MTRLIECFLKYLSWDLTLFNSILDQKINFSLKKLMKTGETYVVDDGSTLYLSTGNAGGIELVTVGNEIITIGKIGEIVRDLPLEKNRLRERF